MINIQDKKDCCGCSACVQRCPKQCITMMEDNEGFIYPQVDMDLCIECGLCECVCPVLNQNGEHEPLKAYAAINTNEEIRMQSSSGGIFTLLAEQVINDGGVVFGARFDEQWEVCHDFTETMEGLAPFRGSKYVQSRIGNSFKQAEIFLRAGRKVLFSGTPCQIAGLKKFLQKEYDNLLTVDLICHGVPSPGVWRQYLNETLEAYSAPRAVAGKNSVLSSLNPTSSIEGIAFRDKEMHGWKEFSFVLRYSKTIADGEKNTVLYSDIHYNNVFMKAFLGDYILRPSCYACSAKSGKAHSDLTIADFWGIRGVLSQFDDDKGTCLTLVNTEKGESTVLALPNLKKEITSIKLALKYNPSYYHSVAVPVKRELFYAELTKSNKIADIVKNVTYIPIRQRITKRIISLSRRIAGKVKQIINK